ncbi:helix-hairpin-helix domain-containing protein [Rhabdaerophilum sp. SD176]|uniref:ComEA family DNA-binding protein n=1 Tax=Rhabdaerophilum sp. SD176 TaxID=2983548 RepID=UPI0024DF5CCE|nr:helix-hairpin-helix domain-containing protein [Rhabdaerophilum sp. SD176]
MVTSRLSKIAAILVIGTGAAFAQATTQQPNTQTRPPAGQPAPRTTAPAAQAPRPAAPAAAAPAATQGTLVNLNTANESELDKLPQIGPARAKDIIEARTKNGRFKNWEDFVARNVVPKNAEEAIKGKVRF